MTTTLTVSAPSDLVALVPATLGFTPDNSLVAVSLRGPRLRVGVVLRADLPPPHTSDAGAAARQQLARDVAGHLHRDGAGVAVLLVYGDTPWTVLADAPHRQLVDAVTAALEAAGIALLDALHLGGNRLRSYRCDDGGCCTLPGPAVDPGRPGALQLELALRGRAPLGSSADLERLLHPADALSRGRVSQVARRWDRPGDDDGDEEAAGGWRREALAGWSRALERAGEPGAARPSAGDRAADAAGEPTATEDEAGRLLAALADVEVRDAVLLWVAGVPLTVRTAGRSTSAGLAAALDRAPDPDRAAAADAVLRAVATRASGREAAGPYAALATLAWWCGNGSYARMACDRALGAEPGHRLAGLVRTVLDVGLPPRWVQSGRRSDGEPDR